MTDNNNSKMKLTINCQHNKMLLQKVCKCGNAVADLLGRIDGFSENLGRVKFGESPHILKAYEESVNYVLRRAEALNDISKIRFDIKEKVRQCSI